MESKIQDRDYRKEARSDDFGRSFSDPNLGFGTTIFKADAKTQSLTAAAQSTAYPTRLGRQTGPAHGQRVCAAGDSGGAALLGGAGSDGCDAGQGALKRKLH